MTPCSKQKSQEALPTHPDAAQALREAGVVIGHSVLIVVDIDREGDLSGYGIARPPVASNPHNDGWLLGYRGGPYPSEKRGEQRFRVGGAGHP